MMRALLYLVLITGAWGISSAQLGFRPTDGNNYLAVCGPDASQSPDVMMQRAFLCESYTAGVVDGFMLGSPHPQCISGRAVAGRLVEVSVKYIQSHPEERAGPAANLILAASAKAFPCGSQAKAEK